MTKIRVSEHYDAPQEVVFEVFSDLAHAAERLEALVRLEILTEGPIGVGTRFRETRVMFGKEATEVMTITAFDPPRHYFTTAASHGSEYEMGYTFTPDAGGTRVDAEFGARPVSFFAKLMSPLMLLMSGTLRKCVRKDMQDLRPAIAERAAGA